MSVLIYLVRNPRIRVQWCSLRRYRALPAVSVTQSASQLSVLQSVSFAFSMPDWQSAPSAVHAVARLPAHLLAELRSLHASESCAGCVFVAKSQCRKFIRNLLFDFSNFRYKSHGRFFGKNTKKEIFGGQKNTMT